MKTFLTFFAAAALTLAATPETTANAAAPATATGKTTTAASRTTAKAAAKPAYQPLTVPKDAVPNGNGGFDYTDKAGTHWVYAITPFGVTRTTAALTKTTDLGDSVRFEQSTPFGPKTWEKKKADLTDDERRVVESQSTSGKTAQNAPAGQN